MEELHIPSAPNWYQQGCVDCSWDGHVAFASRNDVVIFHSSNPYSTSVIASASPHKSLNVSFAPKGQGKRILVSSEDGVIRVWDFEQGICERVSECHKGHQKPYAHWSHADGNIAVCVDENGILSCWNLKVNTTRILTCKVPSMVMAACCPHHKDLAAVGTKGGLVCVVNIQGKGSILQKLRGHDNEIVSLVWCPVPDNVFDKGKKSTKPCLLASGARDQIIYFWRAADNGLYEKRIVLPAKQKTHSGQSTNSFWTGISWPDPLILLATSPSGELFACDLDKLCNGGGSKQLVGRIAARSKSDYSDAWRIVRKQHSGIVYGITCSIHCPMVSPELKNCDENNWRTEKGEQILEKNAADDWRKGRDDDKPRNSEVVWTIGYDHFIVGTSWKTGELVCKMPSFAGAVHALAISPIDGSSLAIGLADKTIRLWNLSNRTPESMTFLWTKISGKVMALAWHPTRDGWLAYGTADGRIGIYDTLVNKPPLILKMYFKDSVYSLQWGPALKQTSVVPDEESSSRPSDYVLYCVGEGRAAVFDPAFPEQSPFSLNGTLKEADIAGKVHTSVKRSDLCWKPDFSLLAIGNDDGSVHLLYMTEDKVLTHLYTVKLHTRLIQDLAWHPESCITDVAGKSQYINWLASSSNETDIYVVDTGLCQSALLAIKEGSEKPSLTVPCVATLKGHLARVAKLSWNPHVGGQLLSASYDECAIVWNVLTQQPLACYTNHEAPVFTCLWSPLNSDIVMTGTYDGKLCLWKVSKQSEILPCNKKKARQAARSKAKKATTDISSPASPTNHELEKEDSQSINSTDEVVAVMEGKIRNKKKTLFPVSGHLLNDENENAAILEHFLKRNGSQSESDGGNSPELSMAHAMLHKRLPTHAGLFGDEAALSQFFKNERTVLEQHKDWDSVLTVDTWQGNIKKAISHATECNSLTDFHVSMAPVVSHKTWVETCSAYAEQLTRAKDFVKASTYLIAIHRVGEAIKLLADNGQFRQAVALAKSRLPPEDPFIETLLRDWAAERSVNGGVALAAVCYAAVGDFEQAARMVIRQKSAPRLFLASQLMMRAGKQDQATMYARDAIEQSLLSADWDHLCSVFQMRPDLEHLKPWAAVYQILISLEGWKYIGDWLLGSDESPRAIDHVIVDQPFINKPILLLPETLSGLKRDLRDTTVGNQEKVLWLAASRKIVLALVSAPGIFPQLTNIVNSDATVCVQDEDQALRYIVHAMAILHDHIMVTSKNVRPVSALLELCVWLATKGPRDPASIFASPPKTSLHVSLRAYLASALLHWLQSENCTDMSVYSKTLCIIDELKADLFSAKVLKYFKVTFRVDCIKQMIASKTSATSQADKIECPTTSESVENKIAKISLSDETSGDSGSSLVANGSQKSHDDSSKAKEDFTSELKVLLDWVQQFEKEYVKVPNPYVCYSTLSLSLKKLAAVDKDLADKLSEQMQELWKQSVENVENLN